MIHAFYCFIVIMSTILSKRKLIPSEKSFTY